MNWTRGAASATRSAHTGKATADNSVEARRNADCISAESCWSRENPANATRLTVNEMVVTGQLETLKAR